MSKLSIAPLIKEFYPEYYSWNEYPVDQCIQFTSVKEPWGILGNFAPAPLVVEGVEFVNSEQLFQMMKFTDSVTLTAIYRDRGMKIKYAAKAAERLGRRRSDWGSIIIDCMKVCLQMKYEQSETFRHALSLTAGRFIVEDQSGRRTVKSVDTWGAVKVGDNYIGSNLLGRLLMELRDNGKLDYHLPANLFDFLQHLR